MISEIRALVRHILREDAADVIEVEARIRIKSSMRTVTDVITDLRGIENVVSVSQSGPVQDAEDGKQRIIALIKLETDEGIDLRFLEEKIREILEVDMLTITSYDGEDMRSVV